MWQGLRAQWDRILGWLCIAAGGAALLVGWFGVSDTPFPAEQLPYILSGGIGGIFLLGLGAVVLLTADLRDEWDKLDRIERALKGEDVADVPVPSDDDTQSMSVDPSAMAPSH